MAIFLQVKNEAVSILAAGIDALVTSLSVTAGEGAKFPLPGAGFNITIDAEILKCTARATDTLTVTRAQEGTTAAAHSLGATVSLNITAKLLDDITANLNALDTSQVTTGRFPMARILDGTAGQVLTAQGAAVDPAYAAVAAGHPDLLLTYILAGTAVWLYAEEGFCWAICFPDTYTDSAVQSYIALGGVNPGYSLRGRMTNTSNFYVSNLYEGGAAADHVVHKRVADTFTTLATEAIDITSCRIRSMKLSCLGSTIKGYRADLVTAKLTVTDTDLTSGKFGVGQYYALSNFLLSPEGYLLAKKVAAGSPSPLSIGYFEAPIIGSGISEDPYRVKMPEFIETHPDFGQTNRFALTHSSLIPSDDRGQPLHNTALVRILTQPDRQAHLNPIAACVTQLKTQAGVREIPKVAVKARAKGMDRKLKDKDLTPDTGWE